MNEEAAPKIVLVGDGNVGKTCLVMRFVHGEFPGEYVPTLFEESTVSFGKKDELRVRVCDTAGREDYDRLRPLIYPDADAFLLCFSMVGPESFANLRSKWSGEIAHFRPGAALVVVGLKSDLVDDPDTVENLRTRQQQPIDAKQADKLARQLGADAFVQCSALKGFGVADVFRQAYRTGTTARSRKHSKASSLCQLI